MGFACEPSYSHLSAGILVLLGIVLSHFLHSFYCHPEGKKVTFPVEQNPLAISAGTLKKRDFLKEARTRVGKDAQD